MPEGGGAVTRTAILTSRVFPITAAIVSGVLIGLEVAMITGSGSGLAILYWFGY
jgi:hypothetical protein